MLRTFCREGIAAAQAERVCTPSGSCRYRLTREWSLNLVNLVPAETVPEQELAFGILHQSDPGCCSLRKVGPLFSALEEYDVRFTGLGRGQAKSRAALVPVEAFTLPTGKQIRKASPLADWTTRAV